MKIHPGFGKKSCPKCKEICAAAKKVCPKCNEEFHGKTKQAKEDRSNITMLIPEEYKNYHILSTVYTPAGLAPIHFPKEVSQESIEDWVYNIRNHFLNKNKTYLMNQALCYYVRYTYDMFSNEYKKICKIIEAIPDIQFIKPENENEAHASQNKNS
jgi:hypothetical protein